MPINTEREHSGKNLLELILLEEYRIRLTLASVKEVEYQESEARIAERKKGDKVRERRFRISIPKYGLLNDEVL